MCTILQDRRLWLARLRIWDPRLPCGAQPSNVWVQNRGCDQKKGDGGRRSAKLSLTVIDSFVSEIPFSIILDMHSPCTGVCDQHRALGVIVIKGLRVHQGPHACFPWLSLIFARWGNLTRQRVLRVCISVHWCGTFCDRVHSRTPGGDTCIQKHR